MMMIGGRRYILVSTLPRINDNGLNHKWYLGNVKSNRQFMYIFLTLHKVVQESRYIPKWGSKDTSKNEVETFFAMFIVSTLYRVVGCMEK
jgi:hypothetical protein